MLYQWFEMGHAAVRPARAAADAGRFFFQNPFNPLTHTSLGRHAAAACEVFERTTRRYERPVFGLPTTLVDGAKVAVTEEVVFDRPFCKIRHFKRDISDARAAQDPRILLVAPMSGHFATLLRGTVETLMPNHEVYITDWQDARDVPKSAGAFDLEDYVDLMRDTFRHFKGDLHVFAVCQPSVPVLTAIALMEAENDPYVPRSMTLAGGPVDTRINPTQVNKLAMERGIGWFRSNVITTVPWPNHASGRSVYPGFLQLTGFMTMNLDRHMKAHKDMFYHLVRGDGDSAEKHRDFYDEYLAVMDLTSEFFLQTIDRVFVNHLLPKGEMTHRGAKVDLKAIKRVALMTIEGEKDDITGIGQCSAAQGLCSNIPAANKMHFECPSVGHYGVFNGSRFRSEIAPRIAGFVRTHDKRKAKASVAAEMAASAAAYGGGASGKRTHNDESAAFTFADEQPQMTASLAAAISQAGQVAQIAEAAQVNQAIQVAQIAQVVQNVPLPVLPLVSPNVLAASVRTPSGVPSVAYEPLQQFWATAFEQWGKMIETTPPRRTGIVPAE
jgi:poly(3-hydroxybutyrate) depolymerase